MEIDTRIRVLQAGRNIQGSRFSRKEETYKAEASPGREIHTRLRVL